MFNILRRIEFCAPKSDGIDSMTSRGERHLSPRPKEIRAVWRGEPEAGRMNLLWFLSMIIIGADENRLRHWLRCRFELNRKHHRWRCFYYFLKLDAKGRALSTSRALRGQPQQRSLIRPHAIHTGAHSRASIITHVNEKKRKRINSEVKQDLPVLFLPLKVSLDASAKKKTETICFCDQRIYLSASRLVVRLLERSTGTCPQTSQWSMSDYSPHLPPPKM